MSIAAGFRFLFVGQLDADGFLRGGLEAPAEGDPFEQLHRLEGAQTAPIAIADDEVITVLGDDQPLVTFEFEAATLPNGVIEMAARDPEFEALAQGTKVQALGAHSLGALQPKGGNRPTLVLVMQRRAKSWEPGNRGSAKWEILVALGAKVRPLFSQITQRAHNPYRYFVTTSKAAVAPWGTPFTVEDNGTDAMPLFSLDGDNPVMFEATLGDGTEDTFELNNVPLDGATSLRVYVEGVLQVLTTDYTYALVTGVPTITFTGGSIPGDGERIVVIVEVDEALLEAA